ncbi:spore wall protein 2 isoform X1 [Dendroctonus ponderosae]|uniref:Uncharacterized protein n=1 Tax=Dendroctonus ponderosae TaxID=77166 RepID=A0AAR5Q3M6_DENPD|nr:spore wall protein 2 isoform X1 [Dendroctonus ponderosae]KAH1012983.1 hypothetical protein HUJ05_012042 [Dendroctonus ponderosae]
MLKYFTCVTLLAIGAFGTPIKDELMFEGPGDTATVESTVREARAAPNHIGDLLQPGVKDAFLYVYGDAENDDGDVHGYSKRMNDKGQDGYKHLDSFHKRDGDKYGYEKHSEYGQEHKSKIDNENEKGIKQAQKEAGGGDGNGEESKSFYSIFGESDKDDKKQAKKNVEAEFNYYGGNGDSGSSSYGGSSEKAEKDGEGSESSIGDDGEGESYEESEESGEGGEEGNDEEEY